MFVAALFKKAERQKQPRYSPTDVNLAFHTMEDYSANNRIKY